MKGVHVPKVGAASIPKPRGVGHIARPTTKIHPAANMRVRLPQGEVNTSAGDPGVVAPGIGRF